jgi:inhibitor of KinA sporulation pathway (predicted exonuclease)
MFKHHSLKHEFATIHGIKPCGMEKALGMLGMSLDGTHHRGIADARNIAKIFKHTFPKLTINP